MVERSHIRFRLNDRTVALSDLSATDTLLDWLRLDRKLTGTKEGCAEGDCGACTVLVGRLKQGRLVYEAVTACIRFLASVDNCHVVTIEHLRGTDGTLHPLQQAMVDWHGSQCGFCTPGIVMSLYGLLMESPDPSRHEIEVSLQGNLCRCTGYRPIVDAVRALSDAGGMGRDRLAEERDAIRAQLDKWNDGGLASGGPEGGQWSLPQSADSLAETLVETPDARIVAGSTDVGLWVTKQFRDIAPVIFVGQIGDLGTIDTHPDHGLTLGATVTYTDAEAAMGEHIPGLSAFWQRLGGAQVRNMGTVCGNIANGSPIGDTPPPLIVLGATISLRRGDGRRQVPLEDYFIAYGEQDRKPGEFIESVTIPPLPEGHLFATYKISKRRDEDISALCGAFNLKNSNGTIAEARIAFGGMAATPKRAHAVEKALFGKPWTEETITAALPAFDEDFQPITDMRASATYRLKVAQNLLRRFFLEHAGETAQLERVVA